MARPWELRVHARWWTHALLGFGLSGLLLNSALLWCARSVLSTPPTAPPWARVLGWFAYSFHFAGPHAPDPPWPPVVALLARDPIETLFASFTLAAAIGIVYATLRERFDRDQDVESTGFRRSRVALQIVGFVLPFLPIGAFGLLLFRFLSTGSR